LVATLELDLFSGAFLEFTLPVVLSDRE